MLHVLHFVTFSSQCIQVHLVKVVQSLSPVTNTTFTKVLLFRLRKDLIPQFLLSSYPAGGEAFKTDCEEFVRKCCFVCAVSERTHFTVKSSIEFAVAKVKRTRIAQKSNYS